MTLDAVDRAFLARSGQAVPGRMRSPSASPAPLREPPRAPAAVPAAPSAAPATVAPAVTPPPVVEWPKDDDDDIVGRLLAAAPQQWMAVAGRIEQAAARGRKVIAIAGTRRGEGRTTLVEGLRRTLSGRGRVVRVVMHEDLDRIMQQGPGGAAVVLVDAGVWFPPGPIRRPRLLASSYGCDAALIVRRADVPQAASIVAALESVGVEPLGEVVTFAGAV